MCACWLNAAVNDWSPLLKCLGRDAQMPSVPINTTKHQIWNGIIQTFKEELNYKAFRLISREI